MGRQGPDALEKRKRCSRHWRSLQAGGKEPAIGMRRQCSHMFSIITRPKPEQLTWVAPSIMRAKS
jgi:hypothetical protein